MKLIFKIFLALVVVVICIYSASTHIENLLARWVLCFSTGWTMADIITCIFKKEFKKYIEEM